MFGRTAIRFFLPCTSGILFCLRSCLRPFGARLGFQGRPLAGPSPRRPAVGSKRGVLTFNIPRFALSVNSYFLQALFSLVLAAPAPRRAPRAPSGLSASRRRLLEIKTGTLSTLFLHFFVQALARLLAREPAPGAGGDGPLPLPVFGAIRYGQVGHHGFDGQGQVGPEGVLPCAWLLTVTLASSWTRFPSTLAPPKAPVIVKAPDAALGPAAW